MGKFLSFQSLPDEILDYQLLSMKQAKLVAFSLPFIECIVGVALIIGFLLGPAILITILLLVIFTGAIAINLFRGRRFKCHCFGTNGAMIGPASLARNFLLIALAIWVFLSSPFTSGLTNFIEIWQKNILSVIHLNSLVAVGAIVVLSLSILFLFSEMDNLIAEVKRI